MMESQGTKTFFFHCSRTQIVYIVLYTFTIQFPPSVLLFQMQKKSLGEDRKMGGWKKYSFVTLKWLKGNEVTARRLADSGIFRPSKFRTALSWNSLQHPVVVLLMLLIRTIAKLEYFRVCVGVGNVRVGWVWNPQSFQKKEEK